MFKMFFKNYSDKYQPMDQCHLQQLSEFKLLYVTFCKYTKFNKKTYIK